MANTSNRVKFGLKNCHYAIATLAADGTVTFGTPVALPGAVSLSLDAEGDNDPFYADDSVYYMVSNNNGYSGDFELALIPESFLTDVMHETEDANGVIVENKDFEEVIRQYDRAGAVIYCDPPYYKAESCYEVEFPPEDHQRLHDVLVTCEGYFIVSYNYQDYICEIYQDCYIFRTSRPNSMSQTAGSEYEEIVITNYDPRKACWQLSMDSLLGGDGDTRYELIHEPEHPLKI